MRVLEVGCGNGETAADVARWFREEGFHAEVIAADNRPECGEQVVRTAETHGVDGMVRFVAADAFALPDLGRFDILLCVNCLAQLVFEGSTSRFPGLDAAGIAAAWRRAPEALTETVCGELLTHWRAQLAPRGTIIILDLDRDIRGDAHARGVTLYERAKWPMLPVALLSAALVHAGFDELRVRSVLQARFAGREDVHPSLGGGAARPQAHVPAPLWPLPSASEDGEYEYAIYVLQAHRRD